MSEAYQDYRYLWTGGLLDVTPDYNHWHLLAARLLAPDEMLEFLGATETASNDELLDDMSQPLRQIPSQFQLKWESMGQVFHRPLDWDRASSVMAGLTPLQICRLFSWPLVPECLLEAVIVHPLVHGAQHESLT